MNGQMELLKLAEDCGALVKPHPITNEPLITFTLEELQVFVDLSLKNTERK